MKVINSANCSLERGNEGGGDDEIKGCNVRGGRERGRRPSPVLAWTRSVVLNKNVRFKDLLVYY